MAIVGGVLWKRYEEAAVRYEARTAKRLEREFHRQCTLHEKGHWCKFDEKARVLARLRQAGFDEYADYLRENNAPLDDHELKDADERLKKGHKFFKSILEGKDLISSYYLIKGGNARRTVARVVMDEDQWGAGSGFLVGPSLFMTNNHVLGDEDEVRRASAQFDYIDAPGDEIPVQIHKLDPEKFFYTNPDLDYTIVFVDDTSTTDRTLADRSWNEMIGESGKALISERVNIIQHPLGGRQELALRENRVVDVIDSYVHYRADTLIGSSGSPVLNDQWQLVALHRGAVPRTGRNKEILLTDGTAWDGSEKDEHRIDHVANEGVRISKIVEDLTNAHANGNIRGTRLDLLEGCFAPPPPASQMRQFRGMTMIGDFFGMATPGDTPGDPDPDPPADTHGLAEAAPAWDALSGLN